MSVIIEPRADDSGERGTSHVLRGALTFATAATVHAAGLGVLAESVGRAGTPADGVLVFDCVAVSEADSAGLAVLLDWRREALRRGVALRYLNLPGPLLQLARISGVDALLTAA